MCLSQGIHAESLSADPAVMSIKEEVPDVLKTPAIVPPRREIGKWYFKCLIWKSCVWWSKIVINPRNMFCLLPSMYRSNVEKVLQRQKWWISTCAHHGTAKKTIKSLFSYEKPSCFEVCGQVVRDLDGSEALSTYAHKTLIWSNSKGLWN